jgi:hypothetical protein
MCPASANNALCLCDMVLAFAVTLAGVFGFETGPPCALVAAQDALHERENFIGGILTPWCTAV